MRHFLWVLCCLGLGTALPTQAETTLNYCLQLANSRQLTVVELPKLCPAAYAELQTQGVFTNLEPKLNETLSIQQLKFLVSSLTAPRDLSVLHNQDLSQIIAEVTDMALVNPIQKQGWEWWQSFLNWLDSLHVEQYAPQLNWLQDFLNNHPLSPALLAWLGYSLLTLLIGLSLWLIYTELKQQGYTFSWQRRRSKSLTRLPSSTLTAETNQPLTTLLPRQQLAVWLQEAISGLIAQQRLPADHSRTPRQMLNQLQQQAAPEAQVFGVLLSTAEPIIYGDKPVIGAELSQCRQAWHSLVSGRL